MGATISGSEIDLWEEPSDETYVLCNHPDKYPKKVTKLEITFSEGKVRSVNSSSNEGPALLRELNELGGSYGIGRTIFT